MSTKNTKIAKVMHKLQKSNKKINNIKLTKR